MYSLSMHQANLTTQPNNKPSMHKYVWPHYKYDVTMALFFWPGHDNTHDCRTNVMIVVFTLKSFWWINFKITYKKQDSNRTFFMDFGTFSKFDEKWDFWTSMRKYAWGGAHRPPSWWGVEVQVSSNFIRKTLQNPWKMSDLGPVFCMWF